MPKKTIEPLEITDTNEIPVVSVDIPTEYEDMTPDPVPASNHLAFFDETSWWRAPVAPRKFENLLPIVSTVVASVGVGATIFALGVLLGAGI